jgi:hypothetical protein
MKSILICPSDRPGVAHLADSTPLALAPLLGKSVLEYWLEALAGRGIKHVLVLASDRPNQVRDAIGDGARWGLKVELQPVGRDYSIEEARAKFRATDSASVWPETDDVVLLDTLPGLPDRPLFESYSGWFAALQAFVPLAASPMNIGIREVQPGVWVGLHAQIDPSAHLHAPCWIGEHAVIGPGANIGPQAILENRVVVEEGARVMHSVIGPETFVGELISVQNSLAHGSMLVNWMTDSSVRVPDAFFLCSLNERRFATPTPTLAGRALAALAMAVTSPIAAAIMAISFVRGESPLVLRLGVRPQRNVRSSVLQTFAYYDLACGNNWLRRWPQFWSVVRGDLTWVGNRPLRPTQALELANDFERLWLTAPVGLVSLADAHSCPTELDDEACAHASFYAVNASRRLDWFVLSRTFLRAAGAWPIRWTRRKESSVALQQLAPKQTI